MDFMKKDITKNGPAFASLGIRHLSRSQLRLLLATSGLETSGDRESLVERLSHHLLITLPWDWRVSRLGNASSIEGPQREYAAVALWKDSLFLVGGGYAALSPEPELMWRYDLVKSKWHLIRDTPRSPCVRSGHSVVVYDNKIWLFGGYSDTLVQYFRDMYTYDFARAVWEPVEQEGIEMESRAWHSVTVIGDNMLLYGDNGDCEQSKENPGTVFVFNFKTCVWSELITNGDAPAPDDVQVISEYKGNLYVLSLNYADSNNTMSLYCLDLERKKWALVNCTGQVPCGRIGCSASVLGSQWIVHGGFPRVFRQPQSWDIVSDTYSFDFETQKWSLINNSTASHLLPRGGHVSIAWRDTVIFLTGTTASGRTEHNGLYAGTGTYCTEVEMLWKCPLSPENNNNNNNERFVTENDANVNRLYNLDMIKRISELYQDEKTSDFILKSNGLEVPVHKVVLAASSSIFQKMFSVDMKEEREGEVELHTISPRVLETMVRYMYGKLDFIPSDIVVELFRVADLYDINGLREECLIHMKEKITVENVSMLVRAADEHNCSELLEACIDYAALDKQLLEIFSSPSYLNMLVETPELGQRFTHLATTRAFCMPNNRGHLRTPDMRNHRTDDLMKIN